MSSKTKTTATNEEARPALVPKLRFPEFRGTEGWRKVALGDLMEITSSKRVHESDWAEAGVPFYRAREIVALNNGEPITPLFISEDLYRENAKRSGEIVPGDLLVSGVGSIGIPYLVKPNDRFYFKDGNIIWLKNRGTKLQGQFLLTLYGTQFVQSQIKTMAGVGTVGTYTIDNANKTVVVFPVDDIEQQKIADCLSSVDELMAAQVRKVAALKTHKKGLMQQLFPRAGETQPRLRFPEFQNVGEWSEGRLADIATVLQGYGFPERHQGLKSGDYPFYKVSDISRSLAAGKVFIEESANYVNESLLKELRAKPIPEGTTVFAKIGEAIRSNRRAITTVPCLIDNNAAGVKRIKGKATDMFIYLLMEQISLIDHAGGVVPAVNKSAIEEIAVKFPEPEEQERIASCLSSLDALITAETQKLEALKTHKKGLMQQLFPSPEEVEA